MIQLTQVQSVAAVAVTSRPVCVLSRSFIAHKTALLHPNSRMRSSSYNLPILCFCLLLFVCVVSGQDQEQNSSSSITGSNVPACLNISSACIAGVSWLDVVSGCCVSCSPCNGDKMLVGRQCNVTHDAVCACARPTYFESKTGTCDVECRYCPTRECVRDGTLGESRCLCKKPECHSKRDIYCENERCHQTTTTVSTTFTRRSNNPGPNILPGWGIGLIAVGIVVGIVLFASCFLCVGFITARRGSDPELRGSDASENHLFPQEAFSSSGTKTSFVSNSSSVYPYLSNHSMLQLLRNSNPQLVHSSRDRLSSLQNSPVSVRSSPQPIRTVRLARNVTTDKLTAIIM